MPLITQLLTVLLFTCLSFAARGEKLRIVTEPWAPYVYEDSGKPLGLDYETTAIVFKRLGIEEQLKGKARMIPGDPVGHIVARGDAEIGFQQISELKPVTGIDIVGPIPDSAQQITPFSAGIVANTAEPAAAKALINYLASPPLPK